MPQRLHLVFGGELVDPQRTEFRDVERDRHRRHVSRLRLGLCRLEGARRRPPSTTPTRATSSPTCTGCATRSGRAGRRRSWASARLRDAGCPAESLAAAAALSRAVAARAAATRGACCGARAEAGKEDPARLARAHGRARACRGPTGQLVWFHAASVGEAASLLEMLRRLQLGARRRSPASSPPATVTSAAVPRATGCPSAACTSSRRSTCCPGSSGSSTTGAPTSRSGPKASSGRRRSTRRMRRGIPMLLINARISSAELPALARVSRRGAGAARARSTASSPRTTLAGEQLGRARRRSGPAERRSAR